MPAKETHFTVTEKIPVKRDAYQNYDPEQEVFSVTNRHKVRQVRRLKSLIQSIESALRTLPFGGCICRVSCIPNTPMNGLQLFVQEDMAIHGKKLILSFEPISFISQAIPDLEYLRMMAKITELDFDAACTQENSRRKAVFQEKYPN